MADRLQWLDSIRGLACITVFLSHFFGAFGDIDTIIPHWVLSHSPIAGIRDGFAAVALFFVLSGFVLSRGHFKPYQTPDFPIKSVWEFYLFRVLRIWVPYAIWYYISTQLQERGYDATKTSPYSSTWIRTIWPISKVSFGEWKNELELIFPTRFDVNDNPIYFFLPQCWTLYWELVMSLLIPFITLLVYYGGFQWISILLLVLMYFMKVNVIILFQFSLGVVLAKYFTRIQNSIREKPVILWLYLVIGWLLYSNRLWFDLIGYWDASSQKCFPTSGVGSVLLIISIGTIPCLNDFFSNKFLTFIGKISYSFYLCHFAIIITVSPGIYDFFVKDTPSDYTRIKTLLVTLVFTIVVSWVSYLIIEYPIIYKKKLVSNLLHKLIDTTCVSERLPEFMKSLEAERYKIKSDNDDHMDVSMPLQFM